MLCVNLCFYTSSLHTTADQSNNSHSFMWFENSLWKIHRIPFSWFTTHLTQNLFVDCRQCIPNRKKNCIGISFEKFDSMHKIRWIRKWSSIGWGLDLFLIQSKNFNVYKFKKGEVKKPQLKNKLWEISRNKQKIIIKIDTNIFVNFFFIFSFVLCEVNVSLRLFIYSQTHTKCTNIRSRKYFSCIAYNRCVRRARTHSVHTHTCLHN